MDEIVAYQTGNVSEQKEIEEFIETEGERLYNKNEFFRDLSRLMENQEFQLFHEKYLSDWTDIQTTVMYMKLYDDIKKTYLRSFSKDASKELVLFITQKIISNYETRKFIVEKFVDFQKGLEVKGFIETSNASKPPTHE